MNKPSLQLNEHPPVLTEPYRKARRSYVLVSALLIAWELIGFDVSEVPLENINITIKSPQAIPAVLIVLIGYFALRLVQEWYQCDIMRRGDKWALSDFVSANMIAGAAIFVYLTQRLLEIQLADLISLYDVAFFLLWFSYGSLAVGFFWRRKGWKTYPRWRKIWYISTLVASFSVILASLIMSHLSNMVLVLGAAPLFTLGVVLGIILERWQDAKRVAASGLSETINP